MIKPFEGLKQISGISLALLFLSIVTLIMVSISLSYHLVIEDKEEDDRDKIINIVAANQRDIKDSVRRIDTTINQNDRNLGAINETIGQNDRNLRYINESIAGSTATVDNQKVIIGYLKTVILQNNETLANQQIIENLTQFLRTNFNETFLRKVIESDIKTNQTLANLTKLLEFESQEHNLPLGPGNITQ